MKRLGLFLFVVQSAFANDYYCVTSKSRLQFNTSGQYLTGSIVTNIGTRLSDYQKIQGTKTEANTFAIKDDRGYAGSLVINKNDVNVDLFGATYSFTQCEVKEEEIVVKPFPTQNCGRRACF